jgi:hypothetical protein
MAAAATTNASYALMGPPEAHHSAARATEPNTPAAGTVPAPTGEAFMAVMDAGLSYPLAGRRCEVTDGVAVEPRSQKG